MSMISTRGEVLQKIIERQGHVAFDELADLSPQDKQGLLIDFLDHCRQGDEGVSHLAKLVSYLISGVPAERRYASLVQFIQVVQTSPHLDAKDIYNTLELPLLSTMQDLELISLCNQLSDDLLKEDPVARSSAVWGLTKIMPYLHPVNQKEYVEDICRAAHSSEMRVDAMEALNTLIYELSHGCRAELVFFLADSLKAQEELGAKLFALDILEKVTPSLMEKERVKLADCVAPLVYYTEQDLVKRALRYFASVIALVPADQRLHYTQMVAGLVNDLSVRGDVLSTLSAAVPFLQHQAERAQFEEVLWQYGDAKNLLEKERVVDDESMMLSVRYDS